MPRTILTDEYGRLAALRRYQIVDSTDELSFDEVTRIVQLVLDVPISAVSLIGEKDQIFKSIIGSSITRIPREAAFCEETLKDATPVNIPDTLADPRYATRPVVIGEMKVRSYVGVPLTSPEGYNVGAICAVDRRPRMFEDRQIEIMQNLARMVIEQFELRQIAKQDFLTGALGRRGFQQELQKEYVRSMRYERPAALVFLDIDHFKKINDAFGHPAGDECLKAVAQACLGVMRQSDVFGRNGGEEFAFLLPETTAHEAMQCVERIREVVENLRFKIDEKVLSVTASFGVAALHASTPNAATWSAEADKALYDAKSLGRNCAVLALPERAPKPMAPVEPLPMPLGKRVH